MCIVDGLTQWEAIAVSALCELFERDDKPFPPQWKRFCGKAPNADRRWKSNYCGAEGADAAQ